MIGSRPRDGSHGRPCVVVVIGGIAVGCLADDDEVDA
jgi:hypothetical protein